MNYARDLLREELVNTGKKISLILKLENQTRNGFIRPEGEDSQCLAETEGCRILLEKRKQDELLTVSENMKQTALTIQQDVNAQLKFYA